MWVPRARVGTKEASNTLTEKTAACVDIRWRPSVHVTSLDVHDVLRRSETITSVKEHPREVK